MTIRKHFQEFIREFGLGHHPDCLLVLDVGLLTLAVKMRNTQWNPLILEGSGGAQGEGAHLAVGLQRLGKDALDGFMRYLLAKLHHYPTVKTHPGFDWSDTEAGNEVDLLYLTSITQEKDPILRQQKLKAYAAEVAAEFKGNPS